jgi:D-alanyl-D-alanine carboxypeptidase
MDMGELHKGWLRLAPFAACLGAAASLILATAHPAEARWRRHYHYHPVARLRHETRAVASAPAEVEPSKYSAIVVDANTGQEIWGVNENALRHPASLTKVMTLYMLFEQLDKGALTLSSRIPVSEHAAAQEPSKLGVPAGESVSVDEAIKAIVTRSANDIAVAVAEKIGGSESNFAALMTHKAHEIGMSRTLYRDASGLPNDEQLTTAHDLATLAQATQQHFPQYFHYFSLREFTYGGEVIGNHDHLLGRVEGVDGIKTGYTRGSGFNLLTSVHRDGRSLVAVVMGGISGPSRDRLMARLIDTHIAEASVSGAKTRFAAAKPDHFSTPQDSFASLSGREPARTAAEPQLEDVAEVAPPAREIEPQAEGDDSDGDAAPARPLAKPTKPSSPILAKAAALDPSKLGWRSGPRGKKLAAALPPRKLNAHATRVSRASDDSDDDDDSDSAEAKPGQWTIQVGATDNPAKARSLLARAKSRHRALASARGFTDKIHKDGDTLYRARFAGLDSASAEKACHDLRHSGLNCFTTRE